MDEILIEEKKYVSSKRAAKITGYAKDYIGQLCREGRVPARLVGRSWYVLETAIQDHRFGEPVAELENPARTTVPKATLQSTLEAPRYEAVPEEILPSINRLREESSEQVDSKKREFDMPQNVQDSWKAWFDRFDNTVENINPETPAATVEDQEESEQNIEEKDDEKEEDTPIRVPIHTISRDVPTDLLPHHTVQQLDKQEKGSTKTLHRMRKGRNMGIIRTIQIAGTLLAMVAAVIAVIGSGYFDQYILSNKQVGIMAGVSMYNR
ncbi:MAG: hypothetical protein NTU85_01400 [Candidatus Kaiserbacteria bacterium]|nr:hypothetical protein [Candidatus Kaiserbacteria bacterium]